MRTREETWIALLAFEPIALGAIEKPGITWSSKVASGGPFTGADHAASVLLSADFATIWREAASVGMTNAARNTMEQLRVFAS
jgi:hypothetical protein